MPTIKLQNCTIEGGLAQAVLDVQSHVSDISKDILDRIAAFNADTSLIDQSTELLNKMLLLAPGKVDDLNANIGIPEDTPTTADDEERLEELGIILVNGILYMAGGTNIEAFRRLYLSLGADTDLFLSLLNGSDPLIVVQTYFQVKKLPTKPSWTLAEVRSLYNNQAIEAIYTAGEGDKYVVVPSFLGANISKEQASREANIPQDQIATNVFWLRSVSQTSATITKLNKLGITGGQLSSTLFGVRLSDLQPNSVSSLRNDASVATGRAISQLQLLLDRYLKIDSASKESLRSESLTSIKEAQKMWVSLQENVRFYATIIENPEEMTSTFLNKNTKEDISYLLTQRRTVSGINFSATTDQIATKLTQSLNISAGTTTLSTLMVNRNKVILDTEIDSANGSLVRNFCASDFLSVKRELQYKNVNTAMECLKASLSTVAPVQQKTTPQMGYASYDSPSSIMFRNVNWTATFNTDGIVDAIDKAADSLLDLGIRQVVKAIVVIVRSIRSQINLITTQYRQVIRNFVQKIESFMSKFMAFHGTLNLDSSILKCVVGLDMEVTLPFLDNLLALLDLLVASLKGVIAELVGIISDLLDKILCTPINLLNAFIVEATSFLPDFCQTNKFKLPDDIELLLQELQRYSLLESQTASAFNRDSLRIEITLQSLPGKLEQFKQSLVCDSNANNRFFKASKIQAGIPVLPAPTNIIGGALS